MPGKEKKRWGFARMRDWLYEYAYLVTLGAVLAVVAASAMYTSRLHAQQAADVEAAAGAPEIRETALPTTEPVVRATPLPTIAPLTLRPSALYPGGGKVWPVSGEVVRGYAQDELVFWEAIGCWQAHLGVDIRGQAGEEVLCIMDGVVDHISRDEIWGYRVCVAQTDGTKATYAGIAVCTVLEGQSVTRGNALGELLAAIPCEAELGAHLHLTLEAEGHVVDPTALLENAKRL